MDFKSNALMFSFKRTHFAKADFPSVDAVAKLYGATSNKHFDSEP